MIWSISTVEPLEILTLSDEICVHCDIQVRHKKWKKCKLVSVRCGCAEKKTFFPECQRKHALIEDMGQYTQRNEPIPHSVIH